MVVLAVIAVMTGISYRLQKGLIERHMSSSQNTVASGFAAVCRQALTVDNELLMINYVKLLSEYPGVSYAYFADASGRILIHTDRRFFYKPLGDWASLRPAGVLEAALPVSVGSLPSGQAVVGFEEDFRVRSLKSALRETMRQVFVAAAGAGAAGVAASLLFAFALTRPIQALCRASKEIGEGNFKTEIKAASRDELGDLAQLFNSMARSLAVLDEIKDEFIANVSHDLRSPMGAIKMYAQYLLEEDPNRDKLLPKHRDVLTTIMDNAMRLNVFVTNVLDAAKMKAGRMEYHLRAVDMDAVARGVQTLFSIVAKKRGIILVADIPASLPKPRADPERLDQVVANLVSNALKFTPEGGRITLGARAAGDSVEIFVEDTGSGISPENLAGLFQRFRQVDTAGQRARRIQGTGLGLVIVKQTVEGMGGRIAASSVLGKGSRFAVILPVEGEGHAAS